MLQQCSILVYYVTQSKGVEYEINIAVKHEATDIIMEARANQTESFLSLAYILRKKNQGFRQRFKNRRLYM